MANPRHRSRHAKPRRRRSRRPAGISGWLPKPATRRRWLRRFERLPNGLRFTVLLVVGLGLAASTNWVYQVVRKPTELFFPVSDRLHKTPAQTWSTYGRLFRRHSTPVMAPELLAALTQVEGSGNPVARTYWRFSMSLSPFDIYRPASSAVGMYQITDGTFQIARRYCIRNHRVAETGPWRDPNACRFNSLYSRVVPSHAIEMTSAYLDRAVADVLRRHGPANASLADRQRLAAVIHLCGAGAGAAYARRGLTFAPGQRCGSHDPRRYVAKVEAMQRTFLTLSRSG